MINILSINNKKQSRKFTNRIVKIGSVEINDAISEANCTIGTDEIIEYHIRISYLSKDILLPKLLSFHSAFKYLYTKKNAKNQNIKSKYNS